MTDPVLVYVSDGTAYFFRSLEEARGDDWNDAPYEHNAGSPYEYDEVLCFWSGAYEEASYGHVNSPFCVDSINAKKTPWLHPWKEGAYPDIWAGTPVSEFKKLIRAAGGRVFVEEKA